MRTSETEGTARTSTTNVMGQTVVANESNAFFFRRTRAAPQAAGENGSMATPEVSYIQPHRCSRRLADLIDAFYGNIESVESSSLRLRAALLWRCFRSEPGEEPADAMYNAANEPPAPPSTRENATM
jgi:hypothetical protein